MEIKRLFCEKIRDIKGELRMLRLKEEDTANCIRGIILLKTIYEMSERSSNYSGIWIAENVYYHTPNISKIRWTLISMASYND